jgi:acyl-CoA thioesterase-2
MAAIRRDDKRAQKTMKTLIEMLALECLGPNLFSGTTARRDEPRIFGGAAVAQSLLAAYETVEGMSCHSLHCYFIHPGDPAEPILYEVDRVRDGGSFATRGVVARQGSRPILNFIASFQKPAEGFEHQVASSHIGEGPDALFDDDLRGQAVGIQLRNSVVPRPGMEPTIRAPQHQMWFRSAQRLGTEPRFHQAVLAYASDFPQLPSIIQPHAVTWRTPGFQFTSLDHSIWFHRPFDFNNWHICEMDTPSASGQRGLSRGTVYSEAGVLVASVAQEAMLRMRPAR